MQVVTYAVTRRNTVGPYKTVVVCLTHTDAVEYIRGIAKENPDWPYDGGDEYKIGNSTHCNTRYRIQEMCVDVK